MSAQEIEKFLEPRIALNKLNQRSKNKNLHTQKTPPKTCLKCYSLLKTRCYSGKGIIAVDDSIVKGTTLERNVSRIIRAGAN